jgi:hypothetical protein
MDSLKFPPVSPALQPKLLGAAQTQTPSDSASDFWSRSEEVRDQAINLADLHRLFIRQGDEPVLRPAEPQDVLNHFLTSTGTLYGVKATGRQITEQERHSAETKSSDSCLWKASGHANASQYCVQKSVIVPFTATPLRDVESFLSLPLADSRGVTIPGVRGVDSLPVAGGSVEVYSTEASGQECSSRQHGGLLTQWATSWDLQMKRWNCRGDAAYA